VGRVPEDPSAGVGVSVSGVTMGSMNDETISALQRLKRRFGRERARLERMEANSRKDGGYRAMEHANRCRYEATQWSLAQGMVEVEICKSNGKP